MYLLFQRCILLQLKSIEHVVNMLLSMLSILLLSKKLKTLDDGRKQTAVGHLSDPGDIQIYDTRNNKNLILSI